MKNIFLLFVPALFFLGAGCSDAPAPSPFSQTRIDDWQYQGPEDDFDREANFFGTGSTVTSSAGPSFESKLADDSIGLSAGGAQDTNNFRENIENGFLPLPTDITHEGLYSEYYFDTGKKEECKELFCPSYTTAVSADPFSGAQEQYVSVGLNSGIKEDDFTRKKLNLVVVMDISGSMSSPFNEYYYDQFNNQIPVDGYDQLSEQERAKTKMQIANESVAALTTHLDDDDRFGMVLFDEEAYLAKPMNRVGDTDMDSIREHILDIEEQGSTNMQDGYQMGTELFEEFLEADQEEYENRIIFLTDAEPNTGSIGRGDLVEMVQDNANDRLYSTFIGVGLDFNTDLIDSMTKVRGANYYSVHSSREFTKLLDEQFDFMVTPLVFDLSLSVDAQGYDIEAVYGSPEADVSTGEIMKVNTLFPSDTSGGETRGGVVLLKLRKTGENPELRLTASYEDRSGEVASTAANVEFEDGEHYDNTGIRKAIALSRYVNVMKAWMEDERNSDSVTPQVDREVGIVIPDEISKEQISEWERQSVALSATGYETIFADMREYLDAEKTALDDSDLEKELDILDTLIDL